MIRLDETVTRANLSIVVKSLNRGQQSNVVAAQHALAHQALCNRAALQGGYTAATKKI